MRLALPLLASLAVLATGCGAPAPTSQEGYERVTESRAQPSGGITPPDHDDDIVLVVDGDIRNPNVDGALALDIDALEGIGLVEYAVDDPQAEGRVAMFRGVLLRDVLNAAGIGTEATTLNTVALNDYAVEIPITDALDYPVLVATSVDGERMSVERFGPLRIVYPYDTHDLDATIHDPRWIWQLASITVR